MRLSCFSSFRTDSFRSEVEQDLSARDTSVASMIRQVARCVEPDIDAPSTQPPKPVRSSRKLISPPLLHTAPEGLDIEIRTPSFVEATLEMDVFSLAPEERENIAAAFEQDAVLGDPHRGRMLRLFNCARTQTNVSSAHKHAPWKKTALLRDTFEEKDFVSCFASEKTKNIIATTPTPKISQMHFDSPLAIPAKAAFEMHGHKISAFSSICSVTSDSSPLTPDTSEKDNESPIRRCTSQKKRKKRNIKLTSTWNPLRRSCLYPRRTRNLKEKICLENEKSEITRSLPSRLRTVFRIWRPTMLQKQGTQTTVSN